MGVTSLDPSAVTHLRRRHRGPPTALANPAVFNVWHRCCREGPQSFRHASGLTRGSQSLSEDQSLSRDLRGSGLFGPA